MTDLRVHRLGGPAFGLAIAVAVVAVVALARPAPIAFAEATDSESVGIQARVAGIMIVDAENQVIELGQLFPGMSFPVPSDGSGEYEVATFLLSAPANADIALTVIYDDLVHESGEGVVELSSPDGPAICYRRSEGDDPCEIEIDAPSGGGVNRFDTGPGQGVASVGYRVTVPPGASAGTYANDQAITLEAEALLGGQPRF